MFTQSPITPKAWINTLVLAGMGVLATTGLAQDRRTLIDRDAVMVSLDDGFIGEFEGIQQVGFLDNGYRSSSCDGCGESVACCCCQPWWAHRCGVFGEFLLLRPGSADDIYTIEQNSPIPGDFPTGPVGRVNIDDESAYRVGFSVAASQYTSLVGSYTQFEGNTSNTIYASAGNVLNSQVIHPSTLTVGAASLQSSANYSIDFQLVDLAYRHIWKSCDLYAINWLAGFRYGQMEQDLIAQQEVSVATGLVTVDTDIDFNGFGMTFGVDGERRSHCTGLMVYSRALTSFLAGNWKASYVQSNQFNGGIVANEYEDYRVTPVLELELGFGWRSPCGRCRASVGYMTSAWYDSVSTREYIDAVRGNNYVSIDDTITFSGLTTRIEANF